MIVGIEVKEVDLDETVENVETWMLVAFSIANELFKKLEPDSDSERIDDLSVDMIFEFIKQYVMLLPSIDMDIKNRFYRASDRFFEKAFEEEEKKYGSRS